MLSFCPGKEKNKFSVEEQKNFSGTIVEDDSRTYQITSRHIKTIAANFDADSLHRRVIRSGTILTTMLLNKDDSLLCGVTSRKNIRHEVHELRSTLFLLQRCFNVSQKMLEDGSEHSASQCIDIMLQFNVYVERLFRMYNHTFCS